MTRACRLVGMTLVLLTLFATACGPAHLRSDDLYPEDRNFRIDPESEILDTAEAREVLEVLYQYRQALVSKDFGTLLRLVSEDYYDNAGTTHTTADDWTRTNLPEIFEMMAEYAEEIQYRVLVKDLQVQGPQARIDFEFQYSFRYRVGETETLDAGRDVNRMEFVREGDRWRIISGM